jgi:hypothetical protein
MTDNITQRMLKDGWVFNYSEDTQYVGASHPRGGEQSICEVKGINAHEQGHAIAKALNDMGRESKYELGYGVVEKIKRFDDALKDS